MACYGIALKIKANACLMIKHKLKLSCNLNMNKPSEHWLYVSGVVTVSDVK